MEREEIVRTLQKFGLSEYEAKAYVSLALLGPAKASEISKDSLVPQSKIYVTLENLMKKQLVEVFDGRPRQFKAVAPREAVKDLLERKKEEFSNLREKAIAISRLLRPIEVDEDVIEGVWVQKGEKYMEVLDRLAGMMKKAKEYVYDLTKEFSYSWKYREAVLRCKKKGVKLHILAMEASQENYKRARWYLENGVRLKVINTGIHPRVMVVDGREAVIRLDGNGFGFHSLWSSDPCFVGMVDNYLKGLWEKAREIY